MNAKALTTMFSTAAISLATSTAALASSGAATNQVFISGPLILLFLGFCALVVVIQCIPAIMTLYGMIKGAASSKEKEAATARHH